MWCTIVEDVDINIVYKTISDCVCVGLQLHTPAQSRAAYSRSVAQNCLKIGRKARAPVGVPPTTGAPRTLLEILMLPLGPSTERYLLLARQPFPVWRCRQETTGGGHVRVAAAVQGQGTQQAIVVNQLIFTADEEYVPSRSVS